MRMLLLSGAVAVLFSLPADAKNFALPDDGPVATVTFPDSWAPEAIDRGAQGNSPDNKVYLAVEIGPAKDTDTMVNEDMEFLKKNNVILDPSTQKTDSGELNGMKYSEVDFTGKDADGPASVQMMFLAAKGQVVMVTYWGATDAGKANTDAIGAIVASIKPIS